MNKEVVPMWESLLMLLYIVASLGSFVYFFHALLAQLPAALALSSELVL
jgi:hypothetical protein